MVRDRFAFLAIGVPFVGCGTNTHGRRTPPTERVTPRGEDLIFDNTTCAQGERRGNAYDGIANARQ